MENKELRLFGETVAVYCDTHTKRKLYGQNVFFLKLGGICSNNWNFKCQIYYLYLCLLHQTNTDDVFNYLDCICLEVVRSFETSG